MSALKVCGKVARQRMAHEAIECSHFALMSETCKVRWITQRKHKLQEMMRLVKYTSQKTRQAVRAAPVEFERLKAQYMGITA